MQHLCVCCIWLPCSQQYVRNFLAVINKNNWKVCAIWLPRVYGTWRVCLIRWTFSVSRWMRLRKLEDQGDLSVCLVYLPGVFWRPALCSPFPRKNCILSPTEPSEHPGSDRNVENQKKLWDSDGAFLIWSFKWRPNCAGIVMRSFKCRIALGNKLKAISVINPFQLLWRPWLLPALSLPDRDGEKSFVCSTLESSRKSLWNSGAWRTFSCLCFALGTAEVWRK